MQSIDIDFLQPEGANASRIKPAALIFLALGIASAAYVSWRHAVETQYQITLQAELIHITPIPLSRSTAQQKTSETAHTEIQEALCRMSNLHEPTLQAVESVFKKTRGLFDVEIQSLRFDQRSQSIVITGETPQDKGVSRFYVLLRDALPEANTGVPDQSVAQRNGSTVVQFTVRIALPPCAALTRTRA